MVEIPDSLVERLKRRQVALVSGLGCSELAGAPGWAALVEWLAARLPTDADRFAVLRLVAAGRIADAVALVRALLGNVVLPEAIREAYPDGAPVPDSIGLAASLPWRAVVTTAFDDMWERALASEKEPRRLPHVLVGTDGDAVAGSNGAGLPVMHLFGVAARPESLCLGGADAQQRLSPSGSLAWLDELRRRRSLVLVGFRATDPDLDWLTSWLSVLPATESPHFLFLDVSQDAEPDAEARLVALRTGMTVIPCPGGTAEAMEILAQLSVDMDAKIVAYDADIDIDAWLARWASDPTDPEPAEVLNRASAALRLEQEWERLLEVLLARFELLEDREEQLAALREAAAIFRGPLSAPDRALTTGLAALRLAPSDDDLWENLRLDAGASGGWAELYGDGAEVARALGGSPDAARIWREIARVARHHLNRPDAAVEAYQNAMQAEPQAVETADELAELLRQIARWADLVPLLRAGAAATKDPVRASKLLLEAGEVLEAALGDGGGAISVFEAALAIDPESERAWVALDRLYEKEGRWADLAALLEGRARRSQAIEAAPLRRRRAEILAYKMGDLTAAAGELEGLSKEDPTDRTALNLLDDIYSKADRPEDQLRTLQRLADIAPTDTERLTLLRRIAAAWETRPGGLDPAADALEHILRIDPRDGDTFAVLVRVYREAKRPIALADVLLRQIDLTDPGEGRVPLYLTLAETYEQDLDVPVKAYEAYEAAAQLDDKREKTYEALVRLAERLERWEACVTALTKWADIATEDDVRTEVLVQAGLLQADKLKDRTGGSDLLDRALKISPDHVGALTALARLCREGGDFRRTAQLLFEAQQYVPGVTEKAELLTAAARIHEEQLDNDDRAIELLMQALEVDPEHVPAGERLADFVFGRRQWAQAEPILEMLLPKLNASDTARAAVLQTRLATVSLELGKTDKALGCFAEAYRLAPESLPVLRAYVDLRNQRGEWKDARDMTAALLRLHQSALPPAEVLANTMRLGKCELELGDSAAALDWFEKAQALDPAHRPAIEALATLHAAKEDWAALVRDKRALKAVALPAEQAPLMEEIGDLYSERLGEPRPAVAAYQAALTAEPARRTTLHKLLDVYSREKDWRAATETLVRLAEIEIDPDVRAKSLLAAALIRRDELGHATEAADLLERVLDETPSMIQAFDALEKLHRDQSDWTELARSYRRMIRRLPPEGENELRLRLWTELGELALKRLRNRDVAVAALEVAASLDPGNVRRQEALADLYVQSGPSGRDKAIAAHQQLIARNPNRLASYRSLATLYGDAGEFDKHWCVAATLSFLGKADANLEALYQRHRPPQLRLPRRRFNEEVWQRLVHPDEDRMLDALFVLVGAYLAVPAARTHAAVGLRRKRRIDLATDARVQARALVRVADTMDLPAPELYLAETESTDTVLLNLQDKGVLTPALVLGPSTLRRHDDFELVFDLSKRMAFMRPERFLRCALMTAPALDVAMRVALALGGSPLGTKPPSVEVVRLTEYLRKTAVPQTIEQLVVVAPKFVAARGEKIDLEKWLVATDLSASRAALVVTGDLSAAVRVISSEPISSPTLSSLSIKDRLKDLIAFSVSEEYFICRRLLGLEVAP